jgi:RHS repeat-associated protein
MTTNSCLSRRACCFRFLTVSFCASLWLILGGPVTRAQSDYAATPPALAPGSPAGSYRLGDIDNVNLFNGNVNVYLPLIAVNGRGGAKASVGMTWNSPARWHVVRYIDAGGSTAYYEEPDFINSGDDGLHSAMYGSYFTRSTDGAVNSCDPGTPPVVQFTLARLHVFEPDGTEHELRDVATGGQRLTNGGCYSQGPSRGRVFVSSDGSGMTYVFDDVIRDGIYADGDFVTGGGGGGWLYLEDGRRFRMQSDGTSLRDRNGNMMTGEGYTDSLNRTITNGVDESGAECTSRGGDASGACQYLSYQGFGGVERRIWISYNISFLPSGVFLPNGLGYHFSYNQYNDLVRIDLPTGGSIEYDYGPGLDGPQPNLGSIQGAIPGTYGGGPTDFHVYRRVTERRLYKEGHVLVNRQTFSKPESTQGGNLGYVEKKLYDSDGTTLLNTERHFFNGSANDTFNVIDPFAYTPYKVGREVHTEFYDAGGSLLRQSDQTWEQRAPVGWWTGSPDDAPSNDPRVSETVTRLENNLTTKTTYGYDPDVSYNSRTDVYEYDYGGGSPSGLLRHTHTDHVTAASYTALPIDGGAYLRNLPSQQWVSNDISGANKVSLTVYSYDEFSLAPCPNIVGHDPAYTTGYTTRGNVTSVTRYANAAAGTGAITSSSHYDIAGNVISTTDPLGNISTVSYADSFSDLNNSRNTYAFPTSTASAVPDPSGLFGSATPLTAASVYDFSTGLVTKATDANGVASNFDYTDPLDRPRQGVYAVGTAAQAQTTIAYDDTNRVVTVTSDQSAYGDNLLKGQTVYDGLGRTIETRKYETATAYISSTTLYDALGRANLVSRPSRGQGAITDGWARTSFDALGRVTEVATFAGAAQPTTTGTSASCANNASCTGSVTTSYSGNTVTVTDQKGKQRRSVSDALGRLVRVDEPDKSTGNLDDAGGSPVQPTSYFYDALGNLRRVDQGGQYRFFMYDSLSRLIRAKNPEQGALSTDADFPAMTDSTSGVSNGQWSLAYNYDASGNLVKRKDARGVVTSYGYDALNRPTTVRYADSVLGSSNHTKDVDRHYDGAVNGKGRFNYFDWDQNGNNSRFDSHLSVDQYDAMGRPLACTQHFFTNGVASAAFTVQRTYDLAGHALTETYPSVHTVSYSYDSAGRLADSGAQPAFSGNLGDGVLRTYASQVTYDQSGGMSQERFGTDMLLYHKLLYNSRAQLAEIRVGLYPLTDPTHGTSWERGAIINQYSSAGWGATSSGHDNNGNLREQDIFIPNIDGAGYDQSGNFGLATQTFSYDYLNRLSAASESSAAPWTQGYVYDRWGNRTIDQNVTTGTPHKPQYTVDAATNRLGVAPNQTGVMSYDAAGNLTNDTYQAGDGGGGTRAYDAEDRMTSAQFVSGQLQTVAYAYDADGHRVKRDVGTAGEVWQVYGLGGELLAEYAANASPNSPQKEYGYRGGELLVVATPALSAAAPSGLAATPTKSGTAIHVGLSWAATGAAYYRVERSADKSWTAPQLVGTSQTNSLDDSGATQGHAYLYRVCAADAGGDCVSAYSNAAMGMAYVFADDPIVTDYDHQHGLNLSLPLTPVRAVHVTDLRAAINAVRALAGLPGAQWAVPDQNLPGAVVLAAHVQEMRDKLGDALAALQIPAPNYTDPNLGGAQPGTVVIQRAHFKDLRDAATSGKCGAGSGGAAATGVEWLVADQLGTPRMVIDHTGSLAGVKRHDYFPFGEEVLPDNSWRTSARGYSSGDNVRQKFTGEERDNETGLDYFGARYYASAAGRFASIDPLAASAKAANPQTWNRYSYALNSPLRYADPSGMDVEDSEYNDYVFGEEMADEVNDDAQQQQQQPPPSAPIIPPFSSELAGSPEYQEQVAQGIPIPPEVVNSYGQEVVNMLGNNNGQCRQFINRVFAELAAPQPPPDFQTAFARLTGRAVFTFSNLGANVQGETTMAGGQLQSVALDFSNMKPTGPDSLPYVLVHETAHTVSPFYDELSNHEQMADAAYKVGRSMGIVPDAVAPPKPSERAGDAGDRYNSRLFNVILYNACNPH